MLTRRARTARRLRLLTGAGGLALALVLCAVIPGVALARQTTRISASFAPERLGAHTTVSFGFQVSSTSGATSPLRGVTLGYPSQLGLATSGLGLASCQPQALELVGAGACPANSLMGHGSALAEVPFGPQLVPEQVPLTLFAGPSPDGYLHLLIYASGMTPVIAQVVITGVLLPGRIEIIVPPIPSLPEAPYVAVTNMHLVLGGALTYLETHGQAVIAYHPQGVSLPERCPHGGFAFNASFGFMDGTRSTAHTAVACPHRRR